MFDRNLMKLDGMRPVLMALVVLALLQAAAVIGQAYALGHVLADLWAGTAMQGVIPGLLAFLACFALLQLLRFGQETMLDRYSVTEAEKLRDSLLHATFDSRSMLATKRGSALIATTVSEDVDEVQSYIRIIPPKLIGMVAISIPILVVAFLFDWVSGIILAVMFPTIIFFMILLGRQASARAERQYATYTRLSNRFMDTLRGLDVIKAFGASEPEAKSVFDFSERLRGATVRTLTTATLSSVVLDLLATLGVAGVAIMLAFRLMDGSMALPTALTVLVIAPEYFAPIRAFASDFHASLDGKNALAAILGMLADAKGSTASLAKAAETEESESKTSANLKAHAPSGNPTSPIGPGEKSDARETQLPSWTEDSRLTLDSVGFKYENGAGIGPLSLTFEGFERVAIVGRSGAGKSTFADVLAGFKPASSGSANVGGFEIDLTSDAWRESVRYIPQRPYLFHATLLDNIRFYAPDAPMREVERAVAAVGLQSLVDDLPDGLMTVIGKGSRELSGGEAHRIALARILVDPYARVLVFDEPTAHLDIETEQDLKPHMLAAMQGKLVLFATHRLHWARDLDRVITLEAGTVKSDVRASRNSHASKPERADAYPPLSMPTKDGENAQVSSDKDNLPKTEPGRTKLPESFDQPAQPGLESHGAARSGKLPLPQWFKGYLSRYKRSVVIALILGLVASGCTALLMFASGYLISATAQPGITLFTIMVPIAFVQVFGIGRPLARYLERLISHDWVLRITSDLRLELYRGIEQRIGDPARERAIGEYLSILADDIAHLQNLYLRVVFPMAVAFLLAIGATVMFGVFSIGMATAMLLAFVITAVALPYAALKATRATTDRAKSARSAHFAELTDDVLGSLDWALAGRGEEAVIRHARADDAIRASEAKMRLVQRSIALASSLLLGIASCLVVYWASSQFGGMQDVNYIAAFALGFFPIIDAFIPLPAAISQAPVHEDAIVRLDEYVGTDAPAGQAARERNAVDEASESLAIELDNVTLRYPNAGRPALHDVNLAIPRAQSVAVLGRSGAGKSTVASLIRGIMEPSSGSIRVFGELPAEARSNAVGFLGQTPYLFNRTLRENLLIASPDADDATLLQALEAVGLGEKFESLDQGLDTIVGETGIGFSGGEAHRIALARVLIADTPIVIVDEPFSALDPSTESALLDTMLATCADKTLVVITHHLAEIERFDRVVFIEGGSVTVDESPETLMAENERFRTLIAFDRA